MTKVAKKEVTDVVAVPDFLAAYGNIGNETVGVDDIIIPRIGLIQQLSPELDSSDPKYIPGAQAGDLFNSLTREIYQRPLKIVFVDRRKEFGVFKKRSAGGGYKGSFPSEMDAKTYVDSGAAEAPVDQLEIVETATNFAILLNDNDIPMAEVVLAMTSTKLKIDRQINSMLRMRGGARFGSVFLLDSQKEKNDKGSWHNLKISIGPWVTREVAETAAKMFEAIHAGKRSVEQEVESSESSEY